MSDRQYKEDQLQRTSLNRILSESNPPKPALDFSKLRDELFTALYGRHGLFSPCQVNSAITTIMTVIEKHHA